MKPVLVAIAGCALVAAVVAWLVLAPREEPPSEESAGGVVPLVEEFPETMGVEEDGFELDQGFDLEAPEPEVETRESFASDENPAPRGESTAVLEATSDTAPVRGLLTDAGTGEPLPYYLLRFEDGAGRREDPSTDEFGRFVTGSPMAGGELRVHFFDDPTHRRSLSEVVVERQVVDAAAPDIDLSVASGPTYRFAIAPPGAVVPTELSARLRVSGPRPPDDQPLRAGDPPWVRFGPIPSGFGRVTDERAERIELRSRDGHWIGSASATALSGIVPGLVEVRLEARAVVRGKVVGLDGTPVAGAQLRYQGVSASGQGVDRRTSTESDGSYVIDFLGESAGTLAVRSFWYAPQDAAIRLLSQRATLQDFVLAKLPPAGSIRGRIESETGKYDGRVRIVLRALPDGRELGPMTAELRWSEQAGRRSGHFEFDALPAGEYEIRVRNPGWFRFEPESVVVSPPSDSTRFLVLDDVAHAEFAFRVRDAETGTGVEGLRAWVGPAGRRSFTKRLRPEESVLTRFPLERKFRWRLDCPGYRPVLGDEAAFGIEEIRGGRTWRFAEIDLVPGWGEAYRVVRRRSDRPVAGAKILLDGREAGVTGADGTCTVAARDRPRQVVVAFRNWTASGPERRDDRVIVELTPPPAK